MLFRLSLLLRIALAGVFVSALIGPLSGLVPDLVSSSDSGLAFAAGDDDDDDDDAGDDDDSSGDDDAAGDDDDDDDDDDGADKDQPPVTAGGLYTKKTWPIREIDRTLTLIKGMGEVRGGLDIDVSDKQAFEFWKFRADARYGVKDNFELQFGGTFQLAGTFADAAAKAANGASSLELGFESAIAYDLVDFRFTTIWTVDPDFAFDMALGFPFIYRPKPNIAVVALDKIMTIHTKSATTGVDDMGNPTSSSKPDLTVGVGIIFQAVEQLAILAHGEITAPRFDTSNVVIPVSVNIQFSPNNKMDLGGEFTLGNLKGSGSHRLAVPAAFPAVALLMPAAARGAADAA